MISRIICPPFGACEIDYGSNFYLSRRRRGVAFPTAAAPIALVPYGTYSYQIAANSPDGSQQLTSPDLGNHVPAYGFSVYTTYDYLAGGAETAGAGISFGIVIDGDQVGVPDKNQNRGDIGFSSLIGATTVDWSPIGCMPPASGDGSELGEIYNFSTGHGPLVAPGEFSPGPWTTPPPYQMAIEFQRANLTGAKNTCGFVGAGGQGGADGGRTKKYTGELNFLNSLTPVSVTFGFKPDFVVFIQQADWKSGLVRTGHDAKNTFGVAVNDGSLTQRSLSFGETTGLAAGAPRQWLSTTNALVVQDPANAARLFSAQVTSFDANGFTMTPTFISAGETRAYFCGFLAVKLHGASCALIDYTTPAATGNLATTGLGFKPGFGLAFMSSVTATDSSVGPSNDSGGLSISLWDASTQWAGGVRIQSGAAPTVTAGFRSQNAMRVATGLNSQASVANFVSFDSGGFTLDWTTVDGTARKGFMLAIGNELAT